MISTGRFLVGFLVVHFSLLGLPALAQQAKSNALVTAAELLSRSRLVDLTHAFDESTIYWPTERGFELSVRAAGRTEQGYFYAANRFSTAEHGGTHLDAPFHFSADGITVERIPLERLIGDAAVIDVTESCAANPDYQVTITDLRHWEATQGRQLVDVIVLIRTGFGKFWPDRERYLGTTKTGAAAVDK